MKKTIRVLQAAALAAGVSLALAGSGFAQEQGAQPPAGAHAGPGHHWDPAQFRARFEARRQRRAQVLHDALGLRPEQEGPWQAFLASTRPRMLAAGPREGRFGRKDDEARAPLTTPQRLDRMAQRMNERQARFQQRATAIKTFYATLDPRQQKTFDALVGARLMGGKPGGFGGRRVMIRG